MMQRNEYFGRGRNRRRDEEGRFARAGRRGGEQHEQSRFSGAPGQAWNRSQEARFGEGDYRDEGFGGEGYRGMTRGGYPDYGAGDAGWGGGYPGYGEQGPGFGRGFEGQGYGGRRSGLWGEGGYGSPGRGRIVRGEGAPQGWSQSEEEELRHWDDDYYHWRSEQLRKFDQDYEDWRNERRRKFSEDFDKWRSSRPERTEGSRTASQADNKNK